MNIFPCLGLVSQTVRTGTYGSVYRETFLHVHTQHLPLYNIVFDRKEQEFDSVFNADQKDHLLITLT
jgi:hypothetical protein